MTTHHAGPIPTYTPPERGAFTAQARPTAPPRASGRPPLPRTPAYHLHVTAKTILCVLGSGEQLVRIRLCRCLSSLLQLDGSMRSSPTALRYQVGQTEAVLSNLKSSANAVQP
eukprot:6736682-Karenia_brevis.AAC.1